MPKAQFNKGFLPAGLGLGIWVLIIFVWQPFSVFSLKYVQILILSAPLFLIPLIFQKGEVTQKLTWRAFFFALFFALSFCMKQGIFAGVAALPGVLFCAFLVITTFKTWLENFSKSIEAICRLAAFVYLLIGALWLLADRLDVQPFGFDPVIVLLTVAHFHFAGFILLMLTGWIIPFFSAKIAKWLSIIVVSGVPLVAIGITTSHFQFPGWIETIAVVVMTFGGASIGFLHFILGWRNSRYLYGLLWMIAGLALMAGMILALLYGLRNVISIPFLTIPWMYAVHGTLNAIGFAIPAISGWVLYSKKNI